MCQDRDCPTGKAPHLANGPGKPAARRQHCSSLGPIHAHPTPPQVEHLQGGHYRGILSPLLGIAKDEGIRGFWKGNGANVLRIIPTSAVRFYSFESYKKLLRQLLRKEDLQTVKHTSLFPPPIWSSSAMCCHSLQWSARLNKQRELLVASACAGTTAAVVAFPIDFVRTRLTAQTSSNKYYQGVVNAVVSIYRHEGPLGFYKGIVPSILNTAPYIAINFTTYEKLKNALGHAPGPLLSLSMGAAAGTLATTLVYPLDLIRKRIIVQGMGGKERTYQGMRDAVKKIMVHEGLRGFYRGLVVTYLKVVPSTAVTWCVVELFKSFQFF